MTFFLSLMFSLQQNCRTRGWNRFCLEGWGEGVQIMYTHVSKCKNDKIKKIKIRFQAWRIRPQGCRDQCAGRVGFSGGLSPWLKPVLAYWPWRQWLRNGEIQGSTQSGLACLVLQLVCLLHLCCFQWIFI
jgi:hypothetical protein